MSLKNSADIIVIGGGIVGCSIAYNLALNGAKHVALLERGDICSGGTAKSCAIVRTHYSIKANLIHAVESLKIFANFSEMIGGDSGFRRTSWDRKNTGSQWKPYSAPRTNTASTPRR